MMFGGGSAAGVGVFLVTLSASVGTDYQLVHFLVPQRSSDVEITFILARFSGSFDVDAVDVEVAGACAVGGGADEAEIVAEGVVVAFPAGLDGEDNVGDGPAVDWLLRFEEGVEEGGDLVRVESCGEGVPENEMDFVQGVGAIGNMENGSGSHMGPNRRRVVGHCLVGCGLDWRGLPGKSDFPG